MTILAVLITAILIFLSGMFIVWIGIKMMVTSNGGQKYIEVDVTQYWASLERQYNAGEQLKTPSDLLVEHGMLISNYDEVWQAYYDFVSIKSYL